MTTMTISERNKANAQHSTGPKSDAGKARSSQNARSHGATAKPSATEVAEWLRVILNKDKVTPEDLNPRTHSGQCALELATAEARLAMTERSRRERREEDWHSKSLLLLVSEISKGLSVICGDEQRESGTHADAAETPEQRITAANERLALAVAAVDAQKHRVTWRYQSEAQARRRRALAQWGQALHEEAQDSARCRRARRGWKYRNEAKLQPKGDKGRQ